LNVAVDAVVNEASVALVFVLAGPDRVEQGGERDLAGGVFLAAGQGGEVKRGVALGASAKAAYSALIG